MRLYRSSFAAAIILAVQLVSYVYCVHAQVSAPTIGVISIAPVDRLMSDVSYLLKASNVPELGGIAVMMANTYTNGLDKTRPAGLMIKLVDSQPIPLAFLPILDREKFFGALESAGLAADDLGSGMFAFDAGGQQLFVKENAGWLFVSQKQDSLADLPVNPAAPLAKLAERYDLAVRINVQQLPADLRKLAIDQMRSGFERSLAEQSGQTDEEKALAEEMGRASLAQIENLIAETEEVVIGWGVEQGNQKTFIELGSQFVAGSELAQQVAQFQNVTSDFTGLVFPGAAITARMTSPVAEKDKALAKNNLRNAMRQLESQIDRGEKLPPEAAAAIKKFAAGLSSILSKTIDDGKFDGGASVTLSDNKLRAIVGGHVADGKSLATEIKQLVASVGSTPGFPKFEFDYATHKNVALHRASLSIESADPQARQVFGDSLNLVIGTADKSFFVAIGPDGEALLKQAIDNAGSGKAAKVSPAEMTLNIGQILQFAQHIRANPALEMAIQNIQQYSDKDRVQVQSTVLTRGLLYRVSIDEGVLRAVGASAKAASGGGPGF